MFFERLPQSGVYIRTYQVFKRLQESIASDVYNSFRFVVKTFRLSASGFYEKTSTGVHVFGFVFP